MHLNAPRMPVPLQRLQANAPFPDPRQAEQASAKQSPIPATKPAPITNDFLNHRLLDEPDSMRGTYHKLCAYTMQEEGRTQRHEGRTIQYRHPVQRPFPLPVRAFASSRAPLPSAPLPPSRPPTQRNPRLADLVRMRTISHPWPAPGFVPLQKP